MKEQVVVVEWGDAFIETDDFKIDDAKETEPVYRKTAGFLVAKNQHGTVLCTDLYAKGNEGAAKMFIPKGMIYKVRKYNES